MGGSWERLIRSVRSVLSVLLQEHGSQLDDEALRTLMTEAENLSDHLLTSKTEVLLPPPGCFERLELYSRKRWRRIQFLANWFCTRWRREYSSLCQHRRKWNTPQRYSREGDIVLLQDDDLPRNQWPLARVSKVVPSKDGRIRKVQLLLTRDGRRTFLERPIHKTILLVAQDVADQDVIPARGASIKDNQISI